MTGRVRNHELDSKGMVAVEFALTASIFMTLMLLTFEVCYDLAVGAALDYGTWSASRFGTTGSLTASGLTTTDRSSSIQAIIVENGGSLLSSTHLQVSQSAYTNFNTAMAASNGATGAGTSSQVVTYTITYTQPYLTPIAAVLAGSANLIHTSTAVVLNEPF